MNNKIKHRGHKVYHKVHKVNILRVLCGFLCDLCVIKILFVCVFIINFYDQFKYMDFSEKFMNYQD